jgi:hypothetical protein
MQGDLPVSGAHRAPRRPTTAETAAVIFTGWVIALCLVAVFLPVYFAAVAGREIWGRVSPYWHIVAAKREGAA